MQFSIRKLLLLALLITVAFAPCYSQNKIPFNNQLYSIDSAEMMRSNPRGFLERSKDGKPLSPIVKSLPGTTIANQIPAGRMAFNASGCSDTSERFFLNVDSVWYYAYSNTRCADGAILTGGLYFNMVNNSISGGYLVKSNEQGVVQWAHLYNNTVAGQPYTNCYYTFVSELVDGTIILAGKSLNPANGHEDLLLTHVDKNGNIIWSKTYASKLWVQDGSGTPDYFYVVDLKQDIASGDLFFTGPHWENGLNLTRVKLTDGTILFSTYYGNVPYIFNIPFGLEIRANDVYVFSKIGGAIIERSTINKTNGYLLENKSLELTPDTKLALTFINADQMVKLDNGHYLLSGKLYRYYLASYDPDQTSPLGHEGIVEVDADFNFVKAWYFANFSTAYYPASNTRATLRKDGSGLFAMLDNNTSNKIYVQFQGDQIISQRELSYKGQGIAWENNSIKTSNGGDLVTTGLGDYPNKTTKLEFLNLHPNDTSSDCMGKIVNNNFVYHYKWQPSYYYGALDSPNDFSESVNRVVNVTDVTFKYSACVLGGCDTISLVKKTDTICISNPLSITVRKNPTCHTNPVFNYDAASVQSVAAVNDSVYNINFKTTGTTMLYGSITTCKVLKDSIKIVVLPVMGNVDLGKDTGICSGNTIVLHAKPGYKSYKWQDGSIDSVFTVKQAGQYHVTVADGCNNYSYDTIMVSNRSSVPFDIGKDTSICEKDSITLNAPASFTNYKWTPDYRISATTTATVSVFPLKDTIYHVNAELSAGCFVDDSLRITVKHAPLINLGPDKNLCIDDSLVLDAGAGFTSYKWNNGNTSQQATVLTSGYYTVSALALNGCRAYDTLQIISVVARPKPDLGTDSVICAGTPRILNAGNYASYSWNTGSASAAISITATGVYAVTVTDNNNCKGYDTIAITKIVNPPSGFLSSDTSICKYGKMVLQPAGIYKNYTWSTGASNATITIENGGMYWLKVEDNNHCIGVDSVIINTKDCMTGFYVPNAFSPGHDGKNDVFRPLIFGNVLQYEFTIFNRYGQIVFISNQPGKGWDGTPAQSATTFVWTCKYQLPNEPVKFEKGVVVLMK